MAACMSRAIRNFSSSESLSAALNSSSFRSLQKFLTSKSSRHIVSSLLFIASGSLQSRLDPLDHFQMFLQGGQGFRREGLRLRVCVVPRLVFEKLHVRFVGVHH